MESLSLGKTTIVEKPCALTRADAGAMFALAEEKGVNLYVAQVLQFTREVEVLRKLVREGTYGRPLDAVFQRLSARPEWAQGGWLFDKSKSGLVPFDLHIHDLDVIVSLFGVPDRAECRPAAARPWTPRSCTAGSTAAAGSTSWPRRAGSTPPSPSPPSGGSTLRTPW